jgi:hypothetical protein
MKSNGNVLFKLLTVAFVLVAVVIYATDPSFAGTPPPTPICMLSAPYTNGTGCIEGSQHCELLAWNYGVNWDQEEECCYNPSTHVLVSQSLYSCVMVYNNGCCDNLDNSSKCAANMCPASMP